MAIKDVEVVPTGGGWHVVVPGKPRARSARVFKTKREAVSYVLAIQRKRRIVGLVHSSSAGAFKAAVKKSQADRGVNVRGKGAAKRKPLTSEFSPRPDNIRRMQAEYDHLGAPGSDFLELIKNAARINEAALNRLAK